MLPQPLLAPAIEYIFAKMEAICSSPVGAWQRKFLSELFRVLFATGGRVNFTNMARYSRYIEQTFRRHFRKAFDWVAFNLVVLRQRRHPGEELIGPESFRDAAFYRKVGRRPGAWASFLFNGRDEQKGT